MSDGVGANLREVVPFLLVRSMERSLAFYVERLGFATRHRWVVDDRVRWCWLNRGGASLMLQEVAPPGAEGHRPLDHAGEGVSTVFLCEDAPALYREFTGRGAAAEQPFVGNGLWVTVLRDPDGYKLDFESPTDVPEDTRLSGWKG
jgi:lactoylglutathione lyase